MATWQLVLAFISPVSGLIIAIGSLFWGRVVVQAKDAQMAQKDEQIKSLERLLPKSIWEQIEGLHKIYADRLDAVAKQAEAELAAARDVNEAEKVELRAELARQVAERRRTLEAAFQSVSEFQRREGPVGAYMDTNLSRWPTLTFPSLREALERDREGRSRKPSNPENK
jgi:hypothetical protein